MPWTKRGGKPHWIPDQLLYSLTDTARLLGFKSVESVKSRIRDGQLTAHHTSPEITERTKGVKIVGGSLAEYVNNHHKDSIDF